MNSKTKDFPTPVSPTRRIVYGLFALLLDVLTIPCLIESTSLKGNTIRTDASKGLLKSLENRDVIGGPAQAGRIVNRTIGRIFVTGRTVIKVSSYSRL